MNYVLRRLLSLVPTLFGIAVLTFLFIRLVPGDVVELLLYEQATPEKVEELRTLFGLDRPMYVQFVDWVSRILRGDLGKSLMTDRPIIKEIAYRFPATLELSMAAVVVSLLIAIPSGVISATRRNTSSDYLARVASLVGLSMPGFWLGLMLILLLGVRLHLLPSGGYVPFREAPLQNLRMLVMPALTMGAAMAAIVMRMTRSSLLEVLGQEYVRVARAKGLSERVVVLRHALRNALIPVITVVGMQVGYLLGGTVVIEEVFSWPGVGRMTLQAIYQRDYPVVQATMLLFAGTFALVNLLVDILYSVIDPRIRYE